ncbi:hypothetical protein ACQ7DA_16780 [Zafaria sp. J156]|uniref:hypothetical protein n=1 Tax=Zafaria sp. J156 TaxID=3116490 RepID=UPI002E79FC51|nr:hypothetical protein [Zafaria sp. J156]MEE1622978.1 hypothetical protein [Zafaria sp. J156]
MGDIVGFLDKLLVSGVAAIIGGGIVQTYRSAQETKRRKSTPIIFDDRLTQQDFVTISTRIAERTPRVSQITATGVTVLLEVRSNSRLSTWTAEIDFNDYGRLTGNYWLKSTNTQSPIPQYFAHALQAEIWKHAGQKPNGLR